MNKMMIGNLIGNSISMITRHPDEWVSFMGPDADEANGWGMFSLPWKNEDGNHDTIFIAWNENGVICEVKGPEGHYREVIA